jgi:hypothetical protein
MYDSVFLFVALMHVVVCGVIVVMDDTLFLSPFCLGKAPTKAC